MIELISTKKKQSAKKKFDGPSRSMSTVKLGPLQTEGGGGSGWIDGAQYYDSAHQIMGWKEIRHPTFNLNVDIIQDKAYYLSSFRVVPLLLATSVPRLRVAAGRSEIRIVSQLNQVKL